MLETGAVPFGGLDVGRILEPQVLLCQLGREHRGRNESSRRLLAQHLLDEHGNESAPPTLSFLAVCHALTRSFDLRVPQDYSLPS